MRAICLSKYGSIDNLVQTANLHELLTQPSA